jgi:hypothetical protein
MRPTNCMDCGVPVTSKPYGGVRLRCSPCASVHIRELERARDQVRRLSPARRQYSRARSMAFYQKCQTVWRPAIFAAYGGYCCDCHEADFDVLTIDHIWGRGDPRYPEGSLRMGTAWPLIAAMFRYHVEKGIWPDGFALRCANCHMRRHVLENRAKSGRISWPHP